MLIRGVRRSLDGAPVARVLPDAQHRSVGPYVFLDHFGPMRFEAGSGIDVRPHPHINLAAVTYLFDGALLHRDSLGFCQRIEPGAINWMTAGAGIVHSERTPHDAREHGALIHGVQLWVALPTAYEQIAPDFTHYAAEAFPAFAVSGVEVRVLIGSAFGRSSPVRCFSSMFYVDAVLGAGDVLAIPSGFEERAVYVIEGGMRVLGQPVAPHEMLVLPAGDIALTAESTGRVVLLGGAPLDGDRHIEWNFVSSSRRRIEEAKADWREGRFPKVPGDEVEFIPLPAG